MHATSHPVAVVTGAAQGVGRRTAEELAARGYALLLIDLHEPAATLGALRAQGILAESLTADVSLEKTALAAAQRVQERFGRVDVLVNNAGISCIRPALETSAAQWQRVQDVNLLGPFLLSRELGRLMLEAGAGSIVNVASVAGLLGIAERSAYNASKHGLIGLTRTLAAEWGGRGVRVNAVCPGWIKTEMDEADQGSGAYSDADIEARVPMGRFATATDVARAIAYLADPQQSAFVNGHTLSVDGGWYADGSWDNLRLRQR
ncbi:NAD(P)-dependent dehydrogenase (short-subunit alcohol dehydrogenase family) [Deinobacterium chartae]|uniref:NAD(P)-dependent dehydrogenase (Short-subunit alcohol dehydrogenase family) n=1 Tax=Deinobacterium chartae TaxID=521158 RepID=A0A841I1I8_9DEIO|nr:SDR family NAD(P)-dependent oxidoreductase [Deinobacterium chartae]MBB6098259.1 NAD(P)-dependent dehydrogenase (short-subunit alcohol dehydrogenase family) [Deinobacterium chartae]